MTTFVPVRFQFNKSSPDGKKNSASHSPHRPARPARERRVHDSQFRRLGRRMERAGTVRPPRPARGRSARAVRRRPMPHFDQPENLRDRRKRPNRAVFRLDRPRIAAKRRSEPARRGIFDRLSERRSAIGRPALPLYVPQSGPPAIARRRRHAGGLLRPAARKGNAAESSLYPRDHAAIAAVDVFRDQRAVSGQTSEGQPQADPQ